MRVLLCEGCGAPLTSPWSELVVVCRYCGTHNLPGQPGAPVPPRVPVDHRPRLNLGGRTYVIEGKIADGDSASVYRGRWVVRLGEAVTIKVLAASADADLMRREWNTLKKLQRSTERGAHHFVTRLPSPIAHGLVSADRDRTASVFGWKSGFVHTLEDVRREHPSGVPGPVVVWILKRLLELLDFVHRSGFVHGAVTPDHILVHPYDHGAMLVGWTLATPWYPGAASRLPARPSKWLELYDGETSATPALDIAMACRSVQRVTGGVLPEMLRLDPVSRVIKRGMSGRVSDAWQLREDLVAASRDVHGPPAYNPLSMPHWQR